MAPETSDCAAVVVGAGPGGLAVVGNLLEKQIGGQIAWIDPSFSGGRISRMYRDVPSNTKVSLFLSFAQAVEPFRRIIEQTPGPNAISAMEGMDQSKGCPLEYAADMCLMLTDGLFKSEDVERVVGRVISADWSDSESHWSILVQSSNPPHGEDKCFSSPRLILCTGSSPASMPISVENLQAQEIHLDTALRPPSLASVLPKDHPTKVAVIGGSHSAIIILINLFDLAKSTHPNIRVKWFARNPLRYAEYHDGWVLRDNTGLKGVAAEFARANLEDDKLENSPMGRVVERHDISKNEQAVYDSNLPDCTHVVQAIGFTRDGLPHILRNGTTVESVMPNVYSGSFTDGEGHELPGLYGAGIAFPELVTDPAGNTEYAVGLWKFMRYIRRVISNGEWNTA